MQPENAVICGSHAAFERNARDLSPCFRMSNRYSCSHSVNSQVLGSGVIHMGHRIHHSKLCMQPSDCASMMTKSRLSSSLVRYVLVGLSGHRRSQRTFTIFRINTDFTENRYSYSTTSTIRVCVLGPLRIHVTNGGSPYHTCCDAKPYTSRPPVFLCYSAQLVSRSQRLVRARNIPPEAKGPRHQRTRVRSQRPTCGN